MPTSLLDAPPEILQRIALFAILSAPLGPPRDLYNLSQLCRKAHRILSGNCPEFYADILAQKFDAPAIIRRFGISAFQENAKIELQRRFAALDIFRKGRLDDPSLTEAFWIAYLMLEEDSTTSLKNVKQLRWANLPAFLDSFFQKRLYKGSVTNNGWPLPNVVNSLAIVLFWLLSSPFRRETPEMRDTILQLLTPFVFAAFRYPIFGSAESYFDLSTSHCCSTSTGVHGPYPPPPLLPQNITYFGRIRREAHVPCVSVFASLSYFTRHETMSPMIPPHLIEAKRQTRVEADALGLSGPTLDDMEHFIHQCQTRFVDYSMGRIQKLKSPPSSIVGQPSYQLGTLTGRWEGSYIMPFLDDYHSWLNELQVPSHFPTTGRFPLYITLQEHFICKPKSIYPWNNVERGTLNAWLPSGLEWVEKPNGIEISDEYGNAKAFYETFQHNQTPTCEERDVGDVIVTGKTDSRHAAAWGAFHVLGRIRLVDGLVVLARESLFDAGTSLLRGYVTSSQNFVGRLKGESSGTEPAAWEGTFSLFPQEVLEQIAFFSVTDSFLGPPSTLSSLLITNRNIHSRLSFASNPLLYAKVFAYKFDIVPAIRRFGTRHTTPYILADELKLRCLLLKQIKARLGSTEASVPVHERNVFSTPRLLCHVYLLMLENEGKNEKQLREYANFDIWLREYWFDELGASRAVSCMTADRWVPEYPETSIAMWLFWFLLKPGDYSRNEMTAWTALHVLKMFALAAHKYDVSNTPWTEFYPHYNQAKSIYMLHYCEWYKLTPPPLTVPAILSFLALVNAMGEGVGYATPTPPSHSSLEWDCEWDCEWARCFSLNQTACDKVAFIPGSVDGIWEGLFTYTEFTAYTAILQGGPPPILQESVIARHRQTWKLREHHLIGTDPSDSGVEEDRDPLDVLSAGDPLRSYFPPGTQIREHQDRIEVQEPGRRGVLFYQRTGVNGSQYFGVGYGKGYVQDIVITGEGHSSWGQFNLLGRVRPGDGLISLSKEYVDGDRGKWLYRGYLVGNRNGNLAGRWRDTLTPANLSGYEGTFSMSRRR